MYKMSWKKLLSVDSARKRSRITQSDIRNDFEKDNHRIISSASYRRLQDKTQVFPLEENDFVRTRLTHSMEVSSFAKSIAQSVSKKIIDEKLDDEFGFNEMNSITSILSSSGLIHDIGNPPFGHFGEDTIRYWFKKNLSKIYFNNINNEKKPLSEILTEQMKEDFLNFEGNAQAIRVVSKLHFIVDENGMNLTYALLNTLIKYPNSSLDIDKNSGDIKDKKMGYNLSEKDLFYNIVNSTGTYDKEKNKIYRHPLTFLLEAADDIAYCTADIEDGLKKKTVSFHDIVEILETHNIFEGNIYYDRLFKYLEDGKNKEVFDIKAYAAQRWIISIQGLIIKDVVQSFIDNYKDIMNGVYKHDLFYNTSSHHIISIFREIAREKILKSKKIINMEIAAHNMISYFLEVFIKAVLYYDSKYEDLMTGIDKKYLSLLSDNHIYCYKFYSKKYEKEKYKELEERISLEHLESESKIERLRKEYEEEIDVYKLYLRLLLVTDYISGMTDSYAKTLYQELKGIK